jgi:hypothetical protein
MKKTTFLVILSIFSFITIIFTQDVPVEAVRWPAQKWSNQSIQSISIKLERSPVHNDRNITFGIFFDNDTTNKSGSFDVVIDHSGCDLKGNQYTFTRANGNATSRKCGESNNFSVSYSNNTGTYDSSIGMTKYKIVLNIPDVANTSLKFKVDAPDANGVGFLGSVNQWDTVPISIDGGDKRNWSTIKIPIQENCSGNASIGSFFVYDIDNMNSLSGAQDNGGLINNPDGWNNADYPNLQFQYIPLKFGLERDSDGYNKVAAAATGFGFSFTRTSNNLYRADNTTSGQYGFISYNFANKSKKYNIILNDWNNDNYFSFTSPYDEFVKSCNNPPPENWQLTSTSQVNSLTIFAGRSVNFTHNLWDIGPDNISDRIDVDTLGVTGDEFWAYDFTDLQAGQTNGLSINRSTTLNNIGPNQCDTIRYRPINKINGVLDNSGTWGSSSACVHVIDPEAIVPSRVEYEKGSGSVTVAGTNINVSNGGSCPVAPITIPYTWSIGGVSGSSSFNYGGVFGCNNQSNLIPISPGITNQLNNQPPGPSGIQYCLNVNNEGNRCGEIVVYEVPFARFYGNDVYSTSRNAGEGKFRFNDSDNANTGTYQERGSVAQYAAFAAGSATNYLDTAAFRYFGTALNPKPATGLLSEGSELSDISAENVYSKITTQSKPEDCLDNYSNVNGQLTNNAISRLCYDLDNATPLNATPQPGNFDYRKKITVFYNNDIYITKNIINTTPSANRTDPEQTAVALFVGNNIYIDKSVTRIDAILVAQNTIDTCFNTTGNSPIANTDLEDTGQCRNKLVINGSVSAKTIKYKRVGGSRYLAPVGSLPGNSDGAGVVEKDGQLNLPQDSGLSAEIINFPAYLYWAQPYLFNESTSGGKVNSIYIAPPRK